MILIQKKARNELRMMNLRGRHRCRFCRQYITLAAAMLLTSFDL